MTLSQSLLPKIMQARKPLFVTSKLPKGIIKKLATQAAETPMPPNYRYSHDNFAAKLFLDLKLSYVWDAERVYDNAIANALTELTRYCTRCHADTHTDSCRIIRGSEVICSDCWCKEK